MWAEALGVARVGAHDNFFDLGGDSLVAIELLAKAAANGIQLDPADVFEHQTVAELARLATRGPRSSAGRGSAVELRAGASSPLFCVHPSTGGVECYLTLAARLPADASVFGLRAAPLADGEVGEATDIGSLAAAYVDAMRAVQPHGPYRLLGWSLGGAIAFEIACQLVSAGERVELLAIIDQGIDPSGAATTREVPFVLAQLAAAGLQVPLDGDEDDIYRALSGRWPAGPTQDVATDLFRPFVTLARANFDALRRYVPGRFPGAVVYFGSAQAPPGADLGWRQIADSVTVVEVPGTHFELLEDPCVGVLATELAARLSP
jgi:thioesterase domain-containing protein